MNLRRSKRIGKVAVTMGVATVSEVNEAGRVVAVRTSIGEPATLDRVLFENQVITADQAYDIQRRLKMRIVYCHQCQTATNHYERNAGSTTKCRSCKARVTVPGNDPKDPFTAVSRRDLRERDRSPDAPPSRNSQAVGLLGAVAAVGGLGYAAVTLSGTFLGIPAAVTAGLVAVCVAVLLRRGAFLEAGSLGLLATTAFVVVGSSLTAPGSVAFAPGVTLHSLLAPLVVLHVAALFVLALPMLKGAESSLVFLALLAPFSYALLFFLSRCVPGVDPITFVVGPKALASVPWFLHPGIITLLGLFPVAAIVLGGRGLFRRMRQARPGLLRQGGFAASLLVLSVLGFGLACAHERLPSPELCTQVGSVLDERCDSWLAGAKPELIASGSVAPAATARD